MRIATFNVNSLRARVDRVIEFLQRHEIDVLAIQETKVVDDKFPVQPFTDAGYQVARHGISQWNGVALASRVGLERVQIGLPGCPPYGEPPQLEARAIGAHCAGVEVWSLYIPNGREIDHPHYHYKLAWLAALRDLGVARLAADPNAAMMLCGDFNVAPLDTDVWDIAAFEGATHVTAPERAAFNAVVDAGFADLVRPLLPGKEGDTYWDYQKLRYQKKEGMRIDFVLGSPALQQQVSAAEVDRAERKAKGGSDHAPVIVEIDRTVPIVEPTPALVEPAALNASREAIRPAVSAADGAGGPEQAQQVISTSEGDAPLW